ncbi:MAG: hypothetical protein GY749_44545 [Desulfobacteraceae bacterium]|nr:hypothetical protein [Desulfobacteraceae bacterium]
MLRVGMQAVALCADISGASVICREIKAAQNSRHSEDIRANRYSLHSHAKHGNEIFYKTGRLEFTNSIIHCRESLVYFVKSRQGRKKQCNFCRP